MWWLQQNLPWPLATTRTTRRLFISPGWAGTPTASWDELGPKTFTLWLWFMVDIPIVNGVYWDSLWLFNIAGRWMNMTHSCDKHDDLPSENDDFTKLSYQRQRVMRFVPWPSRTTSGSRSWKDRNLWDSMDSNYGTHVSGKTPTMVPVLIMDWLLNIDEPWSQGRILCMGGMIIRLDVSWFFMVFLHGWSMGWKPVLETMVTHTSFYTS